MKRLFRNFLWFYTGGVVATLAYTLTLVWSATNTAELVFTTLTSMMLAFAWPVYLAFAWLQHYGAV